MLNACLVKVGGEGEAEEGKEKSKDRVFAHWTPKGFPVESICIPTFQKASCRLQTPEAQGPK